MLGARVAVGGIMHETHSFMGGRTVLGDFAAGALHRGEGIFSAMAGTRTGIGGMLAAGLGMGWEVLPTLYAAAMPSGIVSDGAYRELLGELVERVVGLGRVDGVLLALHGAMVSESERDVEGDILRGLREEAGYAGPIVVLVDMHGNVSGRMVGLCDGVVAYNTNPHVDVYERGVEAADVLGRLLRGEVRPRLAIARPGLLLAPQRTDTADMPLAAVHGRAVEMRAEEDVVAIAVMAGFAFADTEDTGASVIVTTDGAPGLAEDYARELSGMFCAMGDGAGWRGLSAMEAVKRAAGYREGPVILVDSADNIGGGTPGDGTEALSAMLAQGVEEGAVVLADAEAAGLCWEAGEGAELSLEIGGKADGWHGGSARVRGVVRGLSDGRFRFELADNHFAAFYGDGADMGRCAWLRVGGVNVLLTERKAPPMDLGQLRHIGIIPEEQRMIVVKSAVAYRAAYMGIAAGVIEMDCAGLCSADLGRFAYRYARG